MILLVTLTSAAIAAIGASTPAPAAGDEATKLQIECDAGKTMSCMHLGIMQRHGIGAPRDARQALERFVAACEEGYALGCAFTGDMAVLGAGVSPNADHGELLLRAACRRDNEWACETLRRHDLISPKTAAFF